MTLLVRFSSLPFLATNQQLASEKGRPQPSFPSPQRWTLGGPARRAFSVVFPSPRRLFPLGFTTLVQCLNEELECSTLRKFSPQVRFSFLFLALLTPLRPHLFAFSFLSCRIALGTPPRDYPSPPPPRSRRIFLSSIKPNTKDGITSSPQASQP